MPDRRGQKEERIKTSNFRSIYSAIHSGWRIQNDEGILHFQLTKVLIIGDIHISSRLGDKIISTIKKYIDSHPDEKNIIFLGDFVYHFSYDRNALLGLYHLFVELFEQGKTIYVLAGNHDRLGQHFVYTEAKKAFDVLQKIHLDTIGNLHFITQSQIHQIEGEKCLFLPFMLEFPECKESTLPGQGEGRGGVILAENTEKNEQISAQINAILLDYVEREKPTTVFHHYYIHNTAFPGQKSKFRYKDIALSEYRLTHPDFKMISGHLHQPFVRKNYACIGSVRTTSSLETNQFKTLARYIPKEQKLIFQEIHINPHLTLDQQLHTTEIFEKSEKRPVGKNDFSAHIDKVRQLSTNNMLDQSIRKTEYIPAEISNLMDCSIVVKVEDLDYEKIDEMIAPELRSQLKECRLKKNQANISEVLEEFELASKNVSASFADRKTLLKIHLQRKFGQDAEKYEKVLRAEGLI